MKGRNNKKKKVAVTGGALAIFALLAGTFAWQSYTEWVKNHMQSSGFEAGRVTIVEEFNPPKGGIEESPEVTKKVNVVNTTASDAFVRVSFEEVLQKLANGANRKTYGNTTDAKFPVVIDASEYLDPAIYTERTANLVVKNKKNGTVIATNTLVSATGETLRLFVTPDDSKGVLIVEKELKKAAFPDNYDFNGHTAAIPVISGSFDADNAVVAQKVSALVEKQPDGNYEVYTQEYTDADAAIKNLGFWGYGVDKGSAAEADWAGQGVNVSAAVPSTKYPAGQSAIDSQITFTQANLDSGLNKGNKWYYDTTSGYFYYLDVLAAGGTTSSVMDKVTFPTVATDPTYYMAAYDLYVGLEAIPAAQSALTAASNGGQFSNPAAANKEGNKTWESNGFGWGLQAGTNDSLLNFYKPLATIVE